MTGVGFGYASMLRALNATIPAPRNTTTPTTTIGRRLRQNATRDLNMARCLSGNGGWPFDLIRRRSLQHVAEENGPVSHRQFSRLQTGENLNAAVGTQACLDDFLHKMAAIGGHPRGHGSIGFAHHAVRRHGGGFYRVVDAYHKVCEHSGSQLIFGVRDFGAGRYSMSVRIDRRVKI